MQSRRNHEGKRVVEYVLADDADYTLNADDIRDDLSLLGNACQEIMQNPDADLSEALNTFEEYLDPEQVELTPDVARRRERNIEDVRNAGLTLVGIAAAFGSDTIRTHLHRLMETMSPEMRTRASDMCEEVIVRMTRAHAGKFDEVVELITPVWDAVETRQGRRGGPADMTHDQVDTEALIRNVRDLLDRRIESTEDQLRQARAALRADINTLEQRLDDIEQNTTTMDYAKVFETAAQAARRAEHVERLVDSLGDKMTDIARDNANASVQRLRTSVDNLMREHKSRSDAHHQRHESLARACSAIRRDIARATRAKSQEQRHTNETLESLSQRLDRVEAEMSRWRPARSQAPDDASLREDLRATQDALRQTQSTVKDLQAALARAPSRDDFRGFQEEIIDLLTNYAETSALRELRHDFTKLANTVNDLASAPRLDRRTTAATATTATPDDVKRWVREEMRDTTLKLESKCRANQRETLTEVQQWVTDQLTGSRKTHGSPEPHDPSDGFQSLALETMARLAERVERIGTRSVDRDEDDDGTATDPGNEESCQASLDRLLEKEARLPHDDKYLTTFTFATVPDTIFQHSWRMRLDAARLGNDVTLQEKLLRQLTQSHLAMKLAATARAKYNQVLTHREILCKCLTWETMKYDRAITDKTVAGAEALFRKGSGKKKHVFDYTEVLKTNTKNATARAKKPAKTFRAAPTPP